VEKTLFLNFQDGRLAINDQLMKVNGESLKDLSNSESMETLRKAMQKEVCKKQISVQRNVI
jgi:hypothetical protein